MYNVLCSCAGNYLYEIYPCKLSPQLCFSKGGVLTVAHTHSLTVQMCLPISGTCSSCPVIFRIIPILSTFLMCMCRIRIPLAWRASITCFIAGMVVFDFSFFTSSAIPKCIALEVVMTKWISLMYMMSMVNVTFLCLLIISHGNLSHVLSITLGGFCLVVLPLAILGLVSICLLPVKFPLF